MSDCTVYIDESGDLGVGKGTRWFVLSAVIVKRTEEPTIRNKINQIRKKLNIQEIHFKKIPKFKNRAYVVRELNEESFTYLNVIVDTEKFDSAKIPSSLVAYNYCCKLLLQRVSFFLKESGRVADIVLSARGTARDGELISYIKDKLFPYEGNGVHASTFEKVTAKAASSWDLLQLADVCATTTFLAYQIDDLGFNTPCFLIALGDHLYSTEYNAHYGIKYFAAEMKPDFNFLKKCKYCAKKERILGATTT